MTALLATQPEPLDERPVAVDVHLLQVAKKPTPPSDQAHQATARVMIVLVLLEVLREAGDPAGEERDLSLGRSGVGIVQAVLGEDR